MLIWFNVAWVLKDGSIYTDPEILENWCAYKSREINKVNKVLS